MTTATKTRWTEKKQNTLEQSIDNLLCYLSLSGEGERPRNAIQRSDVTPSAFTEPEVLLDEELPQDKKSEWLLFTDVKPSDVSSRFDVSVCSQKVVVDEDSGLERPAIGLIRMQAVPIRQARGAKIYSPFLARYSQCSVFFDSGTFHGDSWLVNWNGSSWVQLNQRTPKLHEHKYVSYRCPISLDPEQDKGNYMILLGVEFTRDLVWRVVLKSPHGISLSLPTGYAGAMSAFKNREPNNSTGRRDALRHWVGEHYRRSPSKNSDVEKEIYVRSHLRGRTPFRWLGLDCELVVSPFDERRNLRLAEQRKALA